MTEPIHILLVDDDDEFRTSLALELERRGYTVQTADGAQSAMQCLGQNDVDVAILDLRMPDKDGIQLLHELKGHSPATEVVMLTGFATMDLAIDAMKAGACDFIRKPARIAEVEVAIQNAFEKKKLKKENTLLKGELDRQNSYSDLVGSSPKLKDVIKIIDKVAPLDSTVLILGESGVGKELIAKSIHRHSNRASEPFIVMDCCSLTENLLQSELFGYEKGAYTGATQLKHGLFEVADGGTLFIDEIGEISPAIQAGLLRVLETGSFRRVGGVKDIHVNVRILAATNRDLLQAINEGAFREDLYYRLNVVSITVPPLRERLEDIPLLVEHLLKTSPIPQARRKSISDSAMDVLTSYHWPGNIRELRNIIERAIILSETDLIEARDLPISSHNRSFSMDQFDGSKSLAEIEDLYIRWVLEKTNNNRKKACEILAIDPKTLYRKLKKS